jgi:hypothetical protein
VAAGNGEGNAAKRIRAPAGLNALRSFPALPQSVAAGNNGKKAKKTSPSNRIIARGFLVDAKIATFGGLSCSHLGK